MQKSVTFLFALLVLGSFNTAHAAGYKIQLKLTDVKDSMVYLAHYFAKPLPTIYKTDSAVLDKNGVATFNHPEAITGGIYMILLSDKKTYFEFLLNDGDDMGITATAKDLPKGVRFKNSPENEKFAAYTDFLEGYSKKQQVFIDALAKAKSKADSDAISKQSVETGKELVQFRKDYIAKYPKSLLTSIFNALETPQVPEGKHLLPSGQVDSTFPYTYYKEHYWDKFNFSDDRLINTPIYDSKLNEYFTNLVLPYEDSMIKECNMLISKARGSKELFQYTLWWATHYVEDSKVMGMDAVFVYLVENYYMKGDATWLTSEQLEKYIDRAHKIAPNVIGNIAPDIKLPDYKNVEHKLSDVKAKYTLLIFWSPECGHCITEMPKIDSVYKAQLKAKGVKIFAVRDEGDEKKWQDMIKNDNLTEWIHVYDPKHVSRYKQDYDVYSTPTIYLLDEKKIIRGKRLDHTNIMTVIEMTERLEKKYNKGKS